MNQLSVNPKTGFLEQPNYHPAFNSQKKEQILRYLEQHPFKIRRACEAVGVDSATFYSHLEMDHVFAQRIQQLKELRVEDVEERLSQEALTGEYPADRIFFLKTWKPDRYNPIQKTQQNVQITVDMGGIENAANRQQVLDATIVPPPELLPTNDDPRRKDVV